MDENAYSAFAQSYRATKRRLIPAHPRWNVAQRACTAEEDRLHLVPVIAWEIRRILAFPRGAEPDEYEVTPVTLSGSVPLHSKGLVYRRPDLRFEAPGVKVFKSDEEVIRYLRDCEEAL